MHTLQTPVTVADLCASLCAQVFRANGLLDFYRYMRIDFETHYGSEYYCPVSLLRVHGLTQMESFRRTYEREAAIAAAIESTTDDEEDEDEYEDDEDDYEDVDDDGAEDIVVETTPIAVQTHPAASTTTPPDPPPGTATSAVTDSAFAPESTSVSHTASVDTPGSSSTTMASPDSATTARSSPATSTTTNESASSSSASSEQIVTPAASSTTAAATDATQAATPTASDSSTSPESAETSSEVPSASSSGAHPRASDTTTTTVVTRNATRSEGTRSSPAQQHGAGENGGARHPLPTPQAGESIYGAIMKRLSSLERNYTLAIQYIDAQSAMLRDAFEAVESRLASIEGSVRLTLLRTHCSVAYECTSSLQRARDEEMVRRALAELERHRSDASRDLVALASRVNVISQEVTLEKRIGIAQLVGLITVFIFVGLTRGSPTTPFFTIAQPQRLRARVTGERVPGAATTAAAGASSTPVSSGGASEWERERRRREEQSQRDKENHVRRVHELSQSRRRKGSSRHERSPLIAARAGGSGDQEAALFTPKRGHSPTQSRSEHTTSGQQQQSTSAILRGVLATSVQQRPTVVRSNSS